MDLSAEVVEVHATEVRERGVTVMRRVLPLGLIEDLAAAFPPLLAQAMQRSGGQGNRGPHRYYVTLPFAEPWADARIIDNPAITAVVHALLGPDAVLCQLASDTPLDGSVDQEAHRDIGPLFPDAPAPTPAYLLAVNIPLVDVTLQNGPTEAAAGSHLRSDADALARLASGEAPLVPLPLSRGDVMIRDVRHIHRGTANRTAVPRPMMVVGYQRHWFHRPDVWLDVPRDVWPALPEQTRHRLRCARIQDAATSMEERTIMPPGVRAP